MGADKQGENALSPSLSRYIRKYELFDQRLREFFLAPHEHVAALQS